MDQERYVMILVYRHRAGDQSAPFTISFKTLAQAETVMKELQMIGGFVCYIIDRIGND